MKKLIILLFIICCTIDSLQAMAPGVAQVAKETARLKKIRRQPQKSPKATDRPIPVRPSPGSFLIPAPPPIKPIVISPEQLPPHGQGVAPQAERKEIFQQISLLPLPEYKQDDEAVLELDTSLVAREHLFKDMLEQHQKALDKVLDAPVMQLVDEDMRLDEQWALIEDMQEWFALFNAQVDMLATYVKQFKDKTCLPNDKYCKDLIDTIKQLQKQLKMYLVTLRARYEVLQ